MRKVLLLLGVVVLIGAAVTWSVFRSATPQGRRAARRARIGEIAESGSRASAPPAEVPLGTDPVAPVPRAPPRRAAGHPVPPREDDDEPEEPVFVAGTPEPEPPEVVRVREKTVRYLEVIERNEGSEWAEGARQAFDVAFQAVESPGVVLEEARCGGTQCVLRIHVRPDTDPEPVLSEVMAKLENIDVDEAASNPDEADGLYLFVRQSSP